MERNIRDLFKNDDESNLEIPENHRAEFLEKLTKQNSKNKGFSKRKIVSIVASVVILVSFSIYFFQVNDAKKLPFQVQVAEIEKEYLSSIDKEWQKFIEVAKDSILVKKYEQKLNDFDTEYQKITKQLKQTPNNIYVLESLIENLQRRLELIKNIKEHIKELNQKQTSNETIYL